MPTIRWKDKTVLTPDDDQDRIPITDDTDDSDHYTTATRILGDLLKSGKDLSPVDADKGFYTSSSDTLATFDLSSAGRALIDDADPAGQRTTLGLGGLAILDTADLESGGSDELEISLSQIPGLATAYQPLDSDLTALAALITQSQGRGILEKSTNKEIQSYLGIREVLTANRTYYVNSSTGSDSNDGLSSGAAFATLAKAIAESQFLDLNAYTLTISGQGTFSETVQIPFLVGQATEASFVLTATSGTASDFVITSAGQTLVTKPASRCTLGNLTIDSTGYSAVSIAATSYVAINGLVFASCGASTYLLEITGAVIVSGSGIIVKTQAGRVVEMRNNSTLIVAGSNVFKLDTGGGAVAFSRFFSLAVGAVAQVANASFSTVSGSATGQRYNLSGNAVLQTFGSATASTFGFGSTNGATATGGQQL